MFDLRFVGGFSVCFKGSSLGLFVIVEGEMFLGFVGGFWGFCYCDLGVFVFFSEVGTGFSLV